MLLNLSNGQGGPTAGLCGKMICKRSSHIFRLRQLTLKLYFAMIASFSSRVPNLRVGQLGLSSDAMLKPENCEIFHFRIEGKVIGCCEREKEF
jgi:hypothetical protein